MAIYLRILGYVKNYKTFVFFSFFLTLLFTVANLFFLPLTRDIFQEISNKNLLNFNNHIFNAMLLFGVRMGAQFCQYYTVSKLGELICIDMRVAFYEKALNLSQTFYKQTKSGDILSRLFSDVDRVRDVILFSFFEFLPQILTLIGVVGYLLMMNWKLTVFSFVMIPVFVVLINYLTLRLKRITHQLQKKNDSIYHIVQESITNVGFIQSYMLIKRSVNRFKTENVRRFVSNMKGLKLKNSVEFTISYFQFLVFLSVIWFGGYEVANGTMNGAELASYFMGMLLLIDPVLSVSKGYNNLQQCFVSAERIFPILDSDECVSVKKEALVLNEVKGEVVFDQVSFAYDPNDSFRLDQLNFKVTPGEMIALVGASGAGKSTLIQLLLRFFDPQEGRVLLDGYDLKDLDLNFLRSQIAFVPQEDVLIRGTVLENIRLGKLDASEREVIEASKLAHAWEFIEKMPDKLLTKVGDRGVRLSGGQKQRVSIARAILRDPKILILDEATSALDSHSEKMVQEALAHLLKDRATFVIAHRLSTVQHAHRILVLENGRIAESGTYSELMEKGGIYAKLYQLQFQDLSQQQNSIGRS